ncbi:MAG: sodium ion-translocating decarboxylase subunit beta [Clostridiales bacterium]|jgi:oxaloacetate decarboxylase beta subunit|nr:sodium ion-translocating decarboxylase subunit beta [Clostridiales bacterium]
MEQLIESLKKLWESTGFMSDGASGLNLIMMVIACLLVYLAVVKKYEPLLLLPIAFGMFIINIPGAYDILMKPPEVQLTGDLINPGTGSATFTGVLETLDIGGIMYYLYQGVQLVIFPPLIFLGIGAMTDFGPMLANPKSLVLGAAAQIGIFLTLLIGLQLFSIPGMGIEDGDKFAASVAIIGGADGPTAIYLTSKLGQDVSIIAIAAYSYMALIPIIQPPVMKLLTTKKERMIRMDELKPVSKRLKIIFPIAVTGVCGILLPDALPLLGMLMLGNLLKESGVVERLSKTAQNELINIVTIFLGIVVGTKAYGPTFLQLKSLMVVGLGLFAFIVASASGVLIAKLMNLFSKKKINPLIGSAGVSAVPMAARVSQIVGQKDDPTNFLLMHAMGPNVAGVIGSAVAAGILLAVFG